MWPAADEKRKNSLQMIDLLMLIVIAACLLCIISVEMTQRRRVVDGSDFSGSVWHRICSNMVGESRDECVYHGLNGISRSPLEKKT